MNAVEHFVLVDFENVPTVDLDRIAGKPARVVLLLGAKQTKLGVALVQQIHRLAAQVELVEVGASGRNALDLTLAYYLGVAGKEHPQAAFHIISKDKDFEPLLAHLKAKGFRIARHESFAGLPFTVPRKTALSKAPFATARAAVSAVSAEASKPVPASQIVASADRLSKLIEQLKKGVNRPKKRATLERHVASLHGNKLSAGEMNALIDQLVTRHVIVIDDKGKVTYL